MTHKLLNGDGSTGWWFSSGNLIENWLASDGDYLFNEDRFIFHINILFSLFWCCKARVNCAMRQSSSPHQGNQLNSGWWYAYNAYPFCYFLNEVGKVLNWRLLWINIKKVPSALIRMVLQKDMDDSVVLSAPGFRSFVIIIDNTKVTLNMMKGEGEHYHLESSLNIVARKHMCSDCLSINYDELQKNQCPTPNDSFWRNLPSHLTPCHLFWLHVVFTPIERTV